MEKLSKGRMGRKNNSLLELLEDKPPVHYIYKEYTNNYHVTDLIDNDWECKWVPSTPVFISAQTGTGKNYFVQNILVPAILEYNRKNPDKKENILILSNRVALNRQNKLALVKIIDQYTDRSEQKYAPILNDLIDKKIDDYHDFGAVKISSYQQLLSKNLLSVQNDYSFVIIDECHFFVNDSTFNCDTEKILDAIIANTKSAVRVYMSATLDDVIYPILLKEKYIQPQRQIYNEPFGKGKSVYCTGNIHYFHHFYDNNTKGIVDEVTRNFWLEENADYLSIKYDYKGQRIEPFFNYRAVIYDIERNYDYIKLIKELGDSNSASIEQKYANLLQEICNTHNDDKWIIFVSSKKEGNLLAEYLNKTPNTQAAFICAETKNNNVGCFDTYQNIVKKEKFNKRILISTAVIDNGINIKDDAIKHIAIFNLDRVSFLQMLGRLRKSKQTAITLYIVKYNAKTLDFGLKRDLRQLWDRLDFDKMSDNEKRRLNQELITHQDYRQGFGISPADNSLYYNQLSKYKLTSSIFSLKNMLKQLDSIHSLEMFEDDSSREAQYFRILHDYKDLLEKSVMESKLLCAMQPSLSAIPAFLEILPTWESLSDQEIIEKLNDHSDPFNSYNIHLDFIQYTYLKKFLYSSGELSKVETEMQELYQKVGYIDEFSRYASDYEKEKMTKLKTRQENVKKQQDKYLRLFNRIYRTENPVREQLLWMELLDKLPVKVDDQVDSVLSDEEFIALLDQLAVSLDDFQQNTGKEVTTAIHDEFLRNRGILFKDRETNLDLLKLAKFVQNRTGQSTVTMDAVMEWIINKYTEYALQKPLIRGKEDKKATFWILTK